MTLHLWAILIAMLQGVRFDGTITLGNIFSAVAFSTMAIVGYRDLHWRIKNIETWRKEHMIDSDARDTLIKDMGKILAYVEFLAKEKQRENEGRRRARDGQF